MLEYFRRAVKGIFLFSFWAIMIGFFVFGIVMCIDTKSGSGVLVIIGGWVATFFLFAFLGSFIGIAEDIAVIRKKLESSDSGLVQANNTSHSTNISTEKQPNQVINRNNFIQSESMFWDCHKCGHTNSISSLYCENCSNRKPQAAENSLKKSEKVNISSEVPL